MSQYLLNVHGMGQPLLLPSKTAVSKAKRFPLVIANGNSKLGQIWNFSLPALVSCPGASPLCKQYCYVKNRNFGPSVVQAYHHNFELSRRADFAPVMITFLQNAYLEWKQGQARIFRLHPAGDFYSAAYIHHWMEIAKALPDWVFYGYTRTWAVPALAPLLCEFRDLPNVHLYASVDNLMGRCDWPLQVVMAIPLIFYFLNKSNNILITISGITLVTSPLSSLTHFSFFSNAKT